METKSHNLKVVPLEIKYLEWFVEVAATRMLLEELKRPELLNEDHMYQLSHYGMTSGTCLVALDGATPVGAIGAILTPNMFNPNLKTLVEIFWYVLPEYRNTRAGAALFVEYDKMGERLANEATISLLETSTINKGSLEKHGWNPGETAFRKQYKE